MAKKDKKNGKASSKVFGVSNAGKVANKCPGGPGNFGKSAKEGKK